MTFEVRKLSEVPRRYLDLNGLTISENRFPNTQEQENWKCAFDEANHLLFLPLKTTGMETRDGFEGYYLLVFEQDPIVFHGWSDASVYETLVTRKYAQNLVVSTVQSAGAVLYPGRHQFNLKDKAQPNLSEKGAREHRKFLDLLSTNKVRRRRDFRDRLHAIFPFLKPKQNEMQKMAGSILAFLDGEIGPQCTAQLEIQVRGKHDSFIVTFSNKGMTGISNIEVSKEAMLDLLSPNFRSSFWLKKSGFDFEDIPEIEDFENGIHIASLRGSTSTTITWPRLSLYEPYSNSIAVRFSSPIGKQKGYLAFAKVIA